MSPDLEASRSDMKRGHAMPAAWAAKARENAEREVANVYYREVRRRRNASTWLRLLRWPSSRFGTLLKGRASTRGSRPGLACWTRAWRWSVVDALGDLMLGMSKAAEAAPKPAFVVPSHDAVAAAVRQGEGGAWYVPAVLLGTGSSAASVTGSAAHASWALRSWGMRSGAGMPPELLGITQCKGNRSATQRAREKLAALQRERRGVPGPSWLNVIEIWAPMALPPPMRVTGRTDRRIRRMLGIL